MKELFKQTVTSIISFEARILLWRKKPSIIAITGNVGKTSTKDAIYTVITKKVRVRKSQKSYNSDIGVALTILGLQNAWSNPFRWMINIVEGMAIALFSRSYPEWLVLEMGVDRPGDMKRLTRWIKPDIVVLTRFPEIPVHVEYFSSPEAVIKEKMELVHALKEDGIVVYNHDDERINLALEEVRQQAIGFSRYSRSQFVAQRDSVVYTDGLPSGMKFTINHGNESIGIDVVGALGAQYTYSHTAAVAVGTLLGVTLEDARIALLEHVPAPGRMRIIEGKKGTVLLDDTYNAAPVAVEQSLMSLSEIKLVRRRIAVLGDMLELGKYSAREHERLGLFAATHADILITVGVRARSMAQFALSAGMSEKNIAQFDDSLKAGKELEAGIQPGDVILVKGSQSMRMERVVKELMAHPEHAEELLVRQEEMWKN